MQHEMISEIETNAPEFVVVSNIGSSWQRRPDSVPDIFNWWSSYQKNYELCGIAEVISLLESKYYWNEDAVRHGPLRNVGFEVYRCKTFFHPVTINFTDLTRRRFAATVPALAAKFTSQGDEPTVR
jgi:hypothetical protein